MKISPLIAYQKLLDRKSIYPNHEQLRVIKKFNEIYDTLNQSNVKKSLLYRLKNLLINPFINQTINSEPKKSIYLWGGVGSGKTMLADIFFNHAPTERKLRTHFHSFMLNTHKNLRKIRKNTTNETANQNKKLNKKYDKTQSGAAMLAEKLNAKYDILFLDELQLHDVADVMILSNLLDKIMKEKILIITSNRKAEDLYDGVLRRDNFQKFVDLINKHMYVIKLNTEEDYRLKQLAALETIYFTPHDKKSALMLEDIFNKISGFDNNVNHDKIKLGDREIEVEKYCSDIIKFNFEQLCVRPLGAVDYQNLAAEFHSLMIENIPVMDSAKRNEAKRFVTLIDVLYEHKVKLICSAAASPEKLYIEGDGAFEFKRTVSRLIEMQSEKYLSGEHLC